MGKRAACVVIAGALGAALSAPPASASAPPSSGSFIAIDFSWNAAGGGHTVVIAQGGTVGFSYPSGISDHNADFTSGRPSSCAQTAGTPNGSVPPLPHTADSPGWSGTCTFDQAGTYRFKCDLHPYMVGTVGVQASGTSATDSPVAGGSSQAIRFAPRQRGARLRGSLRISRAGQGGSLQASVLARAADLGRHGSKNVTVGQLSSKLHAGTVKVSVSLGRSARNALVKRARLRVQVKLVVRTPAGRTVRATRVVTLLG